VRQGDTAGAAAASLVRQLEPSRLGRLAAAIGVVPRGAALGRALGRRDRDRLRTALTPLLDPDAADPFALVRLGFVGWGGRNPEAVHYFDSRFGTPRHLVALAAAEAAGAAAGPVLDLGCGVGHLTWWLDQRFGEGRTVGVDVSLFELWAAAGIAGGGRFLCADAAGLPLATASFGLVLSSDMLSFVAGKWAVAREAARVLAPRGTLAFAAVKSSLRKHVYAGMPLSPDGWRALAGDLPSRLYADDRVLDRYLTGQGMDGEDAGDVSTSATVTLLAGAAADGDGRRDWGSTGEWPHACGPLGVNPLLRLAEEHGGNLVYRRRFPSASFEQDNVPVAAYLPEQVEIPRKALDGDRLDPGLVDHLVPSTAVVAMPAAYRRANLPPGTRPVARP
jgi:SAM-dependent methyltransferase